MALSKPTNGSNADYANRIGLLFDAVNSGNYPFPATQVPSADANTLDDYEEGTWTPALTFSTPGNLSVAYSTLVATYTKIGRMVFVDLTMVTSTFTHTTASGECRIGGLPFTVSAVQSGYAGPVWWSGITKANYTDVNLIAISSTSYAQLAASGSGQAQSYVSFGDVPTAGVVVVMGRTAFNV